MRVNFIITWPPSLKVWNESPDQGSLMLAMINPPSEWGNVTDDIVKRRLMQHWPVHGLALNVSLGDDSEITAKL